jgi:hypothetical protein
MSGFISSSPFHNMKWFLQIQSLAPSIARRSSGQFQLRRQLWRAITPNLCIVCRIRGYRCVRLVKDFVAACSVHRFDPWISGNRWISSRLRRGSSSSVRTSIVVPKVSSCSSFSRLCRASLTLPSPSPAVAPLPPLFPLPAAPLSPSPAAVVAGGGSRAPCDRARARAAQPCPSLCSPTLSFPVQPPPLPLLSLPWMGERRWGEEEDGSSVNLVRVNYSMV